ncbi:aldolase/citrate lyase family protein [Microvirga pakistanensis]|uniref:HpcH/HpaI aldolase/citrate lyase family protein n=1 Tax=Microvirga pakistanensis TaxID=1682650 RepID=UPI00106AE3F4
MPGSHARAIEKAKTLPADAVIFDLEDAVAPEAKAEARDAVCAAVKTGVYGRRERVIRINGLDTAWGEAGFRTECIEGRDYGFDGKTLIHPSQIAVANEVFAPSAEEVESARAIAALFEQPENLAKGAVSHNGRMVERLHAQMAKRTLALAEAIAASSSSPALSR